MWRRKTKEVFFFLRLYFIWLWYHIFFHDLLHEYWSVLFVFVISINTECILSRCFEKMLWILVQIHTGGGFEMQFPPYSSDSCEWHWVHRAGSWATGDSVTMPRSFQAYLTVLAESWRSSVEAQEHSHTHMSVQWITEQRSIKSASETQYTCGSCNVTTPSMWRVTNNELCVGILIEYIVLKDIRHI